MSIKQEQYADVDQIQALRELIQKRFIELATEMPQKSRRALKEVLDQVVTQVSGLREAVEGLQRRSAPPKKAASPKSKKKITKTKR